ncbi:uncharacterized protein LOC107432129 [Ziziphus jujuba]|uniref:Mitochondrial import inner membrane translocase subunit TIM50 n=2 Tax=Ziziphus jujuba TaxID=326968 RepID=A0ABM3I627_ZIZJJ|nr:uncharacterized protein LOC107432129 [Ziziphus jujuba]KAH7512096.1 hypothetical protein FEM48_Zijuj12G0054200 [Ziziphus jujuba var. spinosa]
MAEKKSIKMALSNTEDFGNDEEDSGNEFGHSLEKLNLGSKKKLLVLDLNGVLVARRYILDKAKIPKSRTPDRTYGSHLVYERPFCDEFMKFCLERFEVGIWSSAMERNVGVLDSVMGGIRSKLLFVWDQSQCTDTGFKCLDNKERPLFIKDLNKVWDYLEKFPKRGGNYSASNTLFIDNEPCKAILNPPNTSIFPEFYDPEDINDDALDPEGVLASYLEELAASDDVPTYVKEHPFGRPAISRNHPDWGFYSGVLRRLGKEKLYEDVIG